MNNNYDYVISYTAKFDSADMIVETKMLTSGCPSLTSVLTGYLKQLRKQFRKEKGADPYELTIAAEKIRRI